MPCFKTHHVIMPKPKGKVIGEDHLRWVKFPYKGQALHDGSDVFMEASKVFKYSNRVPMIVEKAGRSDIAHIGKKKYLVPVDLSVGQFVYVVRKRIKLSAEKAIFVFIDNTLPPASALMCALYEEHKDEDGFLYMTYSGENTFGCQQE
ncbi:hypothetical protein RYX36_012330 [Vicia faba]